MNYKFLQSVAIGNHRFQAKENKGIYEVPEEVESHPHFIKYLQCGYVVEADVKAADVKKSPVDRQKEVVDRLIKQQDEKRAASSAKLAKKEAAPEEVKSEEAPKEEVAEESDEKKEKKKHAKKH